ncbi:uncharacterized protein [Nerophis lumbriciformis]|uniref:uncharacterized protein n=1 Tax=Nerophis lumbriciformis TaxID=546530 RepID=UPI002AE08292|nr:uncharacterized protein LOC133575670 [Nerophis lumbriciformis]
MCERTMAKYEEELCPTKEEKERQQQLLDAYYKKHHQVVLHRTDIQQPPHIKEEDPQPPNIKEEEEEVWITQEGECRLGQEASDLSKFPLTVVSVKTEEHEDKPPESSQLHHSPEHLLPEEEERSFRKEQGLPQLSHIKDEDDAPETLHYKKEAKDLLTYHIKDEEKEHSISQEGEHFEGLKEFSVTGVPVKSEDDEVKGESEEKSSSSTQHMTTETDGDHHTCQPSRQSPGTTILPNISQFPAGQQYWGLAYIARPLQVHADQSEDSLSSRPLSLQINSAPAQSLYNIYGLWRVHNKETTKRKNEEETVMATTSKKKKYACPLQNDWKQEFQFIQDSSKGKEYVACKFCRSDFSIEHGGRTDILIHERSANHKAAATQPSIMGHLAKWRPEGVTYAETKMSMLIAASDIPFSFADVFNKSVKDMFPDSEIARQYSNCRTRATQIMKGAIAPELDKEVIELCQNQPFGLMCDESTSRDTDKDFVILARVCDPKTQEVVTRFLHMSVCNIGTEQNLFESLNTVLSDRQVDWRNVVAFNSDNASVMKGMHNSVVSRIKDMQPSLIDMGCICHLVQLATGCGIKALRQPIEDILSSIYAHFDISAKPCKIFKEFVEFTDSETLKILQHCETRWLSLLTCINRVLNQWDALQAYFAGHEDVEKPGKVKMLAEHLTSKETKFFFLFLSQALKPLAKFNVMFQAEGVMVHRLHREMTSLVRRLMGRFLPASLIADVPLKDIKFKDTSLQLPDSELFPGAAAQSLLEDNMDKLSSSVPMMIKAVRDFFVAVTTKMMTAFPLDNIILQNLTVLDPESRHRFSPNSVIELGKSLPQLRLDLDRLREEVVEYQVLGREDLPQEARIDRFWAMLGRDGKFQTLVHLMKALLCVPHSNASSERVFSMVRKIVTENRTKMDNSTLNSLLSCKLNFTGAAHTYAPSKAVLLAAQHCTFQYNNE